MHTFEEIRKYGAILIEDSSRNFTLLLCNEKGWFLPNSWDYESLEIKFERAKTYLENLIISKEPNEYYKDVVKRIQNQIVKKTHVDINKISVIFMDRL